MDRRPKTIVFAGGGTGGHLYPALALATELHDRNPTDRIEFVGAVGGLEERLVPRAGYPLRTLRLAGLKGASLANRLTASVAAARGVLLCILQLRREPVDLVVGVGGFASGPAVLAGWLMRVRTMVLEQNHFPGATNRWLGPRVDAVCLPAEEARERIRGRIFVTGNPVRREFFEIGEPESGRPPTLLVFGGSRGARTINHALCAALGTLAKLESPPRIVHQTGLADEAEVRAAYASYPDDLYEVHPFLDNMAARLAAADLVVSRAGALTVAELSAAGRPAILVPYPYAADDHQRYNAAGLAHAGAAEIVTDEDLGRGLLVAAICRLLGDRAHLLAMGRAARSLARPDATVRIADLAEQLLEGALDGIA